MEFEIGDEIRITKGGPNNTSVPEYDCNNSMKASDEIFIVKDIKSGGKYTGHGEFTHTLILNTGHPVWACCCKLMNRTENYEIY